MAWRTVPVWGSLTDWHEAQVLARGSALRATVDLTAREGAYAYVKIGRGGTTALTNGVDIRFRPVGAATPAAVGDTHPGSISLLSLIAAATSVTVDADSASGQTTLNVSTTTGFTAGEVICIQDSGGGVTRLEWARISKITNPGASGTVTANAGTNLNTSALALESGGNLAAAAASLAALVPKAGTPVLVALTTTDEVSAISAPGAGNSIYVVGAIGGNTHATTLTTVTLKEGAAGTARFSQPMAGNGGGFSPLLPAGFVWKLPENTALVVQQSAAVNSFVTICAYTAAT